MANTRVFSGGATRAGGTSRETEPALLVERQVDVWTFTINRPDKRNAFSADLVETLIEAVDAAHRQEVPVLVFRGSGKNFSAGFDFGGFEQHSEGDLVLRFVRLEIMLQKVAASPAITVGLAHGRNFGAGVDLFAVCKHRVCTADATFCMPGLKFGLVLGTRRYAAVVGREKAASILVSARSFNANEALETGFVHALKELSDCDTDVADARAATEVLNWNMRSRLYRVLDENSYDSDLAELVYSASQPGLKDRIRQYLNR